MEKDEALAVKVATTLQRAGYEVATAVAIRDGIQKLYEAHPDLIIVDKELPMVKGEASYTRMRRASYVPLIILGSKEQAVEMLEIGADAFMTKPPNLRELVARVRSLLRRKPRHDPPQDNPNG